LLLTAWIHAQFLFTEATQIRAAKTCLLSWFRKWILFGMFLTTERCETWCSSYSWWAINVSMQWDRGLRSLSSGLAGCKAVLV